MNYKEFAGKIRAKYPGSYDDLDDMTLAKSIVDKYPVEYSDVKFDDPKPSLLRKGWNALAIPEQKSKEGLQMLAKLSEPKQEVTGNLLRDVVVNAPKIGFETLSEVAPGFVSRGSILTAGTLKGLKMAKPLIKALGRGVAKTAESVSGLEYKTPGVLQEAAANPKLIFGPGKAAAEYESAKIAGDIVRPSLANTSSKLEFVKKAEKLADSGKLSPIEALEARKELSAIKKTVTGEYLRKTTEKFNQVAKPVFGKADEAYKQGIKSDALRMVLPVNKSGGTSIAKSALGSIAGAAPLAIMSPVVQGTVASGVGATANLVKPLVNNPVTTTAALEVAKQVNDQFHLKPDVELLKQGIKKEVKPTPVELKPSLKELPPSKAKEYLKKALKDTKGDVEKARILADERARKDGYDTSLK